MSTNGCSLAVAASVAFAPGLFVVWEAANSHRRQILEDLRSRFDILGIYEIEWSRARVMRNFERFYSDTDVRGVYHIFNKGPGRFTLVLVRDPRPQVAVHQTSRGERTVNANFLNAKQQYRGWTQGLEVHCSETPEEARRDVMMLVGKDMNTCQAGNRMPAGHPIETVRCDVTGSDGWSSVDELFSTLNECLSYVVLFERGGPRRQLFDNRDRPLQVLTGDLPAMHRILNAEPVLQTAPQGGVFEVQIAGRPRKIAIRFPGDGFLDERWARAMLDRRVFDHCGFYRLTDADYFDSLAYHLLAHRPSAPSLRDELCIAAHRLERRDWSDKLLTNAVQATRWLDDLLERRGFSYSEPLDPSIDCSKPVDANPRRKPLQRLGAHRRRLCGMTHAMCLRLRDHVVLRLPWLRSLKHRLPRNRRAAVR